MFSDVVTAGVNHVIVVETFAFAVYCSLEHISAGSLRLTRCSTARAVTGTFFSLFAIAIAPVSAGSATAWAATTCWTSKANSVREHDVDLEQYARRAGALHDWEQLR